MFFPSRHPSVVATMLAHLPLSLESGTGKDVKARETKSEVEPESHAAEKDMDPSLTGGL